MNEEIIQLLRQHWCEEVGKFFSAPWHHSCVIGGSVMSISEPRSSDSNSGTALKRSFGDRLKGIFRRKTKSKRKPEEALQKAQGQSSFPEKGDVIEGSLQKSILEGSGEAPAKQRDEIDSSIEPADPTQIVHQGELHPIDSAESGIQNQPRLTRMMNPLASSANSLPSLTRRIDYMALAEAAAQILQGRGYAFYGKLVTILLSTFFLADVLAILAGSRIPDPPLVRGRGNGIHRAKTLDEYSIIMTRNLFNHLGKIPGEETPGGAGFDPGEAPVKTTLPLDLLGIVILRDQMRSIATIEDKSTTAVYPIRIDEEIPGKARIVSIEPRRVVFVNIAANRREFLELPEEGVNPRVSLGASTSAPDPGIEQVAANQFNIDRKEVDKALGDLNNILTQARAVPNFENGVAAGYKLFQIVPGSIYDKLGLKNGDVIAGFDGQPVTDPGQAFALLNGLKQRSSLDLQIKRDGKAQTFSYEIH